MPYRRISNGVFETWAQLMLTIGLAGHTNAPDCIGQTPATTTTTPGVK